MTPEVRELVVTRPGEKSDRTGSMGTSSTCQYRRYKTILRTKRTTEKEDDIDKIVRDRDSCHLIDKREEDEKNDLFPCTGPVLKKRTLQTDGPMNIGNMGKGCWYVGTETGLRDLRKVQVHLNFKYVSFRWFLTSGFLFAYCSTILKCVCLNKIFILPKYFYFI